VYAFCNDTVAMSGNFCLLFISDPTVTKLDFDKAATPPSKRHSIDVEIEETEPTDKIQDRKEVQVKERLY